MGRSAKVHKRTRKKEKSSQAIGSTAANNAQASAASVQAAKKSAGFKNKVVNAKRNGTRDTRPLLQGADYVTLLLGGRKKAREEAEKLSKA